MSDDVTEDTVLNYVVEGEATITTNLLARNKWEAIEQFEQAHGDYIDVEVKGMPLQIKICGITASLNEDLETD